MGIYMFRTDVLLKLLRWCYPTANDFGSEMIPMAAEEYNVQAYLFNGYWEDIGTIKSFFDANLALTDHILFPLAMGMLFSMIYEGLTSIIFCGSRTYWPCFVTEQCGGFFCFVARYYSKRCNWKGNISIFKHLLFI